MEQPFNSHRQELRAVIADDLTGSCDTGAQFSRFGMRVAVTQVWESLHAHTSESSILNNPSNIDLLVINTASRRLAGEEAQALVARLTRSLITSNIHLIYKKIDSTLKGPWCQELDALMSVLRPDLTIVAPAFPNWGRIIRGGKLFLKQQNLPLDSAKDPESLLIYNTDVLASLQAQFGSRVKLLNRKLLQQTPATINKHIQAVRSKKHNVLLCDVESTKDLEKLALTGRHLNVNVLWVGSAGLARFLPIIWEYCPSRIDPVNLEIKGPLLLICGSLNAINKPQLEKLHQQGLATIVTLGDEDTYSPSSSMDNKLKQALEALEQKRSVALNLHLHKRIHSRGYLHQMQQLLKVAAGQLIDTGAFKGTVLVGGDTSLSIYKQSGAQGIRILGEVQSGIPYGRWIGGQLDGLPIVTKAGGFGTPYTLSNLVLFLRGQPVRKDML